MSDEQEKVNQQFREIADQFIDLANQKCEDALTENVNASLMYSSARFCAFVVASHAETLNKYESDRETAIEFFMGEFKRMLEENLNDYKRVYTDKYTHLMKK